MADISKSVQAGADFASGLKLTERKDAAYNALANTYGVALAGDPDTAIKDQTYTQNALTNPIAVQQDQANLQGKNIANTGAQQENDYNALANPLKLTGLGDANTNTEAATANTEANTNKTNTLLPGDVAQQKAQLGQTKAQTGLLGSETRTNTLAANTAQAAQDRTSAMGILASLSDVASSGGDVGGTFDKLAPLIAKYEGVTADHLPPLRAALVQDPVGTINRLSEAINAANISALGGKAGGTAALGMLKFGQQQMNLKDGLGFVQQRVAAVPDATQQALALVPKMSTLATIRKVKQEIPGTPEYQFNQVVQQIKSNLSLDDIRSLRAAGVSLGKPNMAEFAGSANAVANLDLGQDTATLAANLNRVNNTYKGLTETLQGNIDRLGNGAPGVPKATTPGRPSLNQQQAPAAMKFNNGQVYVDGQGNKATTKDGGKTWTEVQ